ncbi:SCO family protein [Massilia glaciei]|nr:SCO family protein [Massilia glaciei]
MKSMATKSMPTRSAPTLARRLARAGAALALAACALPGAGAAVPVTGVRMEFVPPAPGSYALHRIMKAPDGVVLASDGKAHRLRNFVTGKVTLFSFIYTYCTDAKGCPLAYATLHTLKKEIESDRAMHGKVRFVSMSFDPEYDTPPMMGSYGGKDGRDDRGLRWHFLTSPSRAHLRPMLDGFGQDVSVAAEQSAGQRVPTLQHMLKVYLIDSRGQVREIYSTSFLQPNVLMNDIKSLLMEAAAARK